MRVGTEHKATWKATHPPAMRDIYYAAGLIEGEGCFKRGSTEVVEVRMTDYGPLLKLLGFFGGSLKAYKSSGLGTKAVFVWLVAGSRARGLMLTLYPLMSVRRQQAIRKAIGR